MIGIVDYGMGNLGSVQNACRFLKQEAEIISRPEQADACDALILPGVGAFGDCMKNLESSGFAEKTVDWINSGKWFLGICLGLQVLFETSEESPGVKGLGIFKGSVRKFDLPATFKVPQIGWNQLQQVNATCPLFKDVEDQSFFYFVHGFYVAPSDDSVTGGLTDYGGNYTAAVFRDNVMATQFHPEKSHKVGLRMLNNFCALIH